MGVLGHLRMHGPVPPAWRFVEGGDYGDGNLERQRASNETAFGALPGHGESPCPRRSRDGDRAASAACRTPPGRAGERRSRGGADRHPVRVAHRSAVGGPAAGDGLRIGPVVLAAPARRAGRRGLGSVASRPCRSGSKEPGNRTGGGRRSTARAVQPKRGRGDGPEPDRAGQAGDEAPPRRRCPRHAARPRPNRGRRRRSSAPPPGVPGARDHAERGPGASRAASAWGGTAGSSNAPRRGRPDPGGRPSATNAAPTSTSPSRRWLAPSSPATKQTVQSGALRCSLPAADRCPTSVPLERAVVATD